MTLNELCTYFNDILHPENFLQDISTNGLQVQSSDMNKVIHKVAFAVDACQETINRTKEEKADVLVVHHGIFWGKVYPLVGADYKRIKTLIDNDIALYASHIPLDANKEVGNNYGMAYRINLKDLQSFGSWRGMDVGVKGKFEKPLTLDEVLSRVFVDNQKPLSVLPFGKKEISTVGIISGGASGDVADAIRENLDLYITGEVEHSIYHLCLENHINFVAGGHYQTETVGVNLLKQKLEKETGLETVFLDVPTSL